jgi:hypothetical protein
LVGLGIVAGQLLGPIELPRADDVVVRRQLALAGWLRRDGGSGGAQGGNHEHTRTSHYCCGKVCCVWCVGHGKAPIYRPAVRGRRASGKARACVQRGGRRACRRSEPLVPDDPEAVRAFYRRRQLRREKRGRASLFPAGFIKFLAS